MTTTSAAEDAGTATAVAPAPPQVDAPAREPVAPPAPPAPSPAPSRGSATPWIISLLVLVTGMFMSVLDVSIVNVAIPSMQKDFGVTTDQIQWVSTAYSLALGVIVPASAWLGERLGLGRAYVVSLVAFGLGSALCGLAWDINSMIVFRILQAIPGGIIPVVALSMVYRLVPRERIGAAMGLYGLGIVFAPAVGPTLGGYLVEYVNWRLIFFINVPIGIIGAIAALMLLPLPKGSRGKRFDVLGFVSIATGLFSLLLALSEGESWGWTSYPVMILFTVGALCLALFVVIELEVDEPMLNVRVFKYWAFTNSLILIAVLSVGLFGVLFFIPLFLQQTQGLGAFDTGLLLLPQALVMGVLMPVAGRIYDRFGPRWPAVIGLSILAIGTWMLRDLGVDSSWSDLRYILMFRAIGMGLAMMPIMTGGISAVPPDQVSGASAFNNVTQRTAAAMGLAALTALLGSREAQQLSDTGGMMGMMPSATGGAASAAAAASSSGSGSGSGGGGGAAAATSQMLEHYMTYQQASAQAFVTALDNLMIVTSVLTAVGVVLACFLRSGPAPSSGGPAVVEA
ncbi:DHA2 family efflux MFS transporter permease subunit [Actinomycetospora endophytica]|uniref:DHA2 family efflux MFS transporter permease subunit n=1 Tax=Actinomycetospora endophytica TaxID=2291215 RepID=A0ABS8PBL2_9PSEU|nr:DHA2 family efflux MFS transporter permease subunit [Actinomycetospora endophytica]MCD2194816.1 DHA2 family efflux MFS transporter permease subunit [Actinomycetospora endophytica]